MQREPARTPAAAARPGRCPNARLDLQSAKKSTSQTNDAANVNHRYGGGAPRGKTSGGAKPPAVGGKVNLAVPGVDPSTRTPPRETWQIAPACPPVQVQRHRRIDPRGGPSET